MASRPLPKAEADHAKRAPDQQRAAEVARQYPGWHVWTAGQGTTRHAWTARQGTTRVATRTGDQKPPEPDDGTWQQTVIADNWTELEHALAEQAQHDAEQAASDPQHP
jgi:hypothetical protein